MAPVRTWQILGNGYRVYSPVLRRFHRPDSLSPFAEGGLNTYAAFGGDPINLADPSGHFAQLVVGAAVLAGAGALVGSAVAGTKGEGATAGILAAVALGVGVAAAGGMHMLRASSRMTAVGVPPATPPVPAVQPGRTVRIGDLRFASGARGDELVAHGLPFATGSTGAVSGHALARQVSTAVGPGYRFKPINMLSCYSAVGGRYASQAQRLANKLNVPVRGYGGAPMECRHGTPMRVPTTTYPPCSGRRPASPGRSPRCSTPHCTRSVGACVWLPVRRRQCGLAETAMGRGEVITTF